MFLIMSGSYVEQELAAEFGNIPPSFLPVGNRRLYRHQISLSNDTIYLSLPEDFQVTDRDKEYLTEHNVHILYTPSTLNIGQAIVAALNLIVEPPDTNLSILFGDTLFDSISGETDIVFTSSTMDYYQWSHISSKGILEGGSDCQSDVICGYFSFSQPRHLVRSITQEGWDFIAGLDRYRQEIGLKSVKTDKWYDFGHVNTFYRSKANFTTERAFNELNINSKFVEKFSSNNQKLKAESNWFKSIPSNMRFYTPQYLGDNEDKNNSFSYCLEYLHNTSLSELYVFSELPTKVWERIIASCLDFIDDCQKITTSEFEKKQTLYGLLNDKTEIRLNSFCEQVGLNPNSSWVFNDELEVSVDKMLSETKRFLPSDRSERTMIHGDFCFSNILYDFRTQRIKTIDPRAIDDKGEFSIYGDIYYDIAKLSHSVLGLYDCIVSSYHKTSIDWVNCKINTDIDAVALKYKPVQDVFIKMVYEKYNISPECLYAMQIRLFLSMLPLHSDDKYRQDGFFANAFRLYQIISRC